MMMSELTTKELEQVSGGLPNVAIGAVAGAIWGGFNYATTGSGQTMSGYALAIGGGAAGGAIAAMGGFSFAFYGGGLGALSSIAANEMKKVQNKGA
jgi:lactobin A/cerein 7B family class IIb bacteriocin